MKNLEAFYKYYSNATKEQAIEDMYMDNCKQAKEIEKLKEENVFLKQLIPNEKKYSYGIRMGSDKK